MAVALSLPFSQARSDPPPPGNNTYERLQNSLGGGTLLGPQMKGLASTIDAAVGGDNVTATGAVCDATTDDTAAIQSTINNVAPLGNVLFPAGRTCKITSTLTVTTSGVNLKCQGNTTAGAAASCRLLWGGGASPMVSFAPATAATYYNGVRGLTLDGNSAASIGIYVNGAQQGIIENVHIRAVTTWAIQSDSNAAHALNTQGWIVSNLLIDGPLLNMGGIDLKCDDAGGLVYCSAFWTLISPQITVNSGTGILFNGGSNNNIVGGRIFGAAGNSIDLSMYVGATGSQSAIGNIFTNTFTQRPLVSRGTPTFPSCTPYGGTGVTVGGTCPFNNFFRLNTFSGGVDPVVEAGSQLNWQSNILNRTTQQAFMGDAQYPGLMIANNQTAFGACLNDALAAGAGTGEWVCSTSTNPVQTWDDGPSQDIWQWNFSGTGGTRDLHLTPTTGTGNLRLDIGMVLKSYTVATLPSCTAPLNGLMVIVSDQAASPVYDAAPTGSGANVTPVVCNSGSWHLH